MAQYAKKLTEPGAGKGVAAREKGPFLRVHSFRDARGGLDASAALGDFDIARELHDNVAQQLTAVSLLLGKLGRNLAGGNISQADEIHRIEEHLLRVTRDVQHLSHGVRSSGVTVVGFNNAIRALTKDVRRSAGLHTILRLEEVTLPDDATAEHLYRIVQEAVHNVIKHAGASSLRVMFKIEGQSFLLVVRDDGNGMSATACAPHDMGFDGMASRARLIGAQLEVRSIPGRGTAVRCVVPF